MQPIWGKFKAVGILLATAIVATILAVGHYINAARADTVGSGSSIAGPISALGSGPWTGFYVGGGVGKTSTEMFIFSSEDTTYTLGGGLKYQIPSTKFVAGVHADYTFTSGGSNFYDMDRSWYVGARLGALLSDNLLLYGSAGLTSVTGSTLGSNEGFTLGGGLELLVTKNVSVNGDYRRVDLGDPTGSGGLFQVSQDEWRIGLNYKF